MPLGCSLGGGLFVEEGTDPRGGWSVSVTGNDELPQDRATVNGTLCPRNLPPGLSDRVILLRTSRSMHTFAKGVRVCRALGHERNPKSPTSRERFLVWAAAMLLFGAALALS